jgi:hypothetical protein
VRALSFSDLVVPLPLPRARPPDLHEGGVTTLGTDKDDNGAAIRPLADGSLLVGGYSRSFGHGGEDAFVARILAPQWNKPHPDFARKKVFPVAG